MATTCSPGNVTIIAKSTTTSEFGPMSPYSDHSSSGAFSFDLFSFGSGFLGCFRLLCFAYFDCSFEEYGRVYVTFFVGEFGC